MSSPTPQVEPTKKKKRIALFGCLTLLLSVLSALAFLEWSYSLVLEAPELSLAHYATAPNVVARLDPDAALELTQHLARERWGFAPPHWLTRRFLPHQIVGFATTDHDAGTVNLEFLLNPRRLGPLIVGQFNDAAPLAELPEIDWAPEKMERIAKGVLRVRGKIPMEPGSAEAAFFVWTGGIKTQPLELEGGHLFEAVLDNRDGEAYLAFVAMLHAYDITLDDHQEEISLSTLQFVLTTRATLDLLNGDALGIRVDIEIQPHAVKRLGVANLKFAIDEGFDELKTRLYQDYGIKLAGQSTWNENMLEYRYRLEELPRLIRLALDGDLAF